MRGCDSHLIFNELDKLDVKISVIPNGLEKHMAFFFNNFKIKNFIAQQKIEKLVMMVKYQTVT